MNNFELMKNQVYPLTTPIFVSLPENTNMLLTSICNQADLDLRHFLEYYLLIEVWQRIEHNIVNHIRNELRE